MEETDTIGRETARRAAWTLLSELFLDVDQAGRIADLSEALRALPFDAQALDAMLFEEVWPVCAPNLRQVAGIWDGFDPERLVAAIEARRGRRVSGVRLALRRWRGRRLIPAWAAVRDRLERHA